MFNKILKKVSWDKSSWIEMKRACLFEGVGSCAGQTLLGCNPHGLCPRVEDYLFKDKSVQTWPINFQDKARSGRPAEVTTNVTENIHGII